ncbi:MAG: DHA2 family efflux MFS transporter permease subunit [Dehalococcoidia bacterium]
MPKPSMFRVVLVGISGAFMVVMDQTIMNVALPRIIAVFNETTDRAQLIVSAYLMASAITIPAAAFLADRFGSKKVFLASEATFLVGSLFCGISWNIASLITFRILQGLAGGVLITLTMAYIFTNVPQENRGTAMAMFGVPTMLAPAIGPTLGGYLVDFMSWRWVFYINIPIVIIALILGAAWMEETPATGSTFDYKGFILAAIGFSSLLYALSYAPTWHWNDPRIISLLALGGICILIWVIVELRVSQPMLDLRIFKNVGYSIGIGLSFITTFGLFSLEFLLPLFLQTVRGLSAFHSGLMVLPQVFGAIVTLPISGKIYDKIGPRVPIVLGLLVTGLSSLWMQSLDVTTPDDTLRMILFVRGMGIGLAMMPVTTYALSVISQKLAGQASALLNVSKTIFTSLGVALFATLLDTFQKSNLAMMAQTVTPGSGIGLQVLSEIQILLMQSGITADMAHNQAVQLLYEIVNQRALITAFEMDYVLSALVVLVGIPAAFLLPSGRIRKSDTQAAPVV